MQHSYFGKYRAIVSDNKDPEKRGRLKVKTNIAPGLQETWALPSFPFAGKNIGMYAIPPILSSIWIEFEAGDLARPIWTGCFWNSKEESPFSVAPLDAFSEEEAVELQFIKTEGIFLNLNDNKEEKGGILLEVKEPVSAIPMKISLDKNGILFSGGEKDPVEIKLVPEEDASKKKIEVNSQNCVIQLTQDELKISHQSSKGEILIHKDDFKINFSGQKIEVKSGVISINGSSLEIS